MFTNGLEKIRRPPIMEKKYPLPHAPQRRSAELSRPCIPLRNTVCQPGAHVVEQQVRIQGHPGQHWCLTQGTSHVAKHVLPIVNGRGSSWRIWPRGRRV